MIPADRVPPPPKRDRPSGCDIHTARRSRSPVASLPPSRRPRSVLVSPRDLVIRALAQVPLPRRPSLRYHGCFAPNSHLRKLVVPADAMAKARCKKPCVEKDETTRITWSLALRQAFGWDVLKCPCGGARTVVAAVQDANEIKRFLMHLHLYPDTSAPISRPWRSREYYRTA